MNSINLEQKLKNVIASEEVVKEGYYAGDYSDGIFSLFIAFISYKEYEEVINYIKKIKFNSKLIYTLNADYKLDIKQDLEELITSDDNLLAKILNFIKDYVVRDQLDFALFKYRNIKEIDHDVFRKIIEKLYIDLFLDDPDFKPELIKFVELQKTKGVM